MTYITYDTRGKELHRYEPAWVREVPPNKHHKMRKYEVWQGGKLLATKYTQMGAANLATGLNKLMERKD